MGGNQQTGGILLKAVLISFDSTRYLATVKLPSSHQKYLEQVAVGHHIPASEMVAGRRLVLCFFNSCNPAEAGVLGVFKK